MSEPTVSRALEFDIREILKLCELRLANYDCAPGYGLPDAVVERLYSLRLQINAAIRVIDNAASGKQADE